MTREYREPPERAPTPASRRATPPTLDLLAAIRGNPAMVLALQRTVGNRATTEVVQREPDEVAKLLTAKKWKDAAAKLAALGETEARAKITGMTGQVRREVTRGARQNGAAALVTLVDDIDHRAAVIGSVYHFYDEKDWANVGTYLCGLNNEDLERVALERGWTTADLGEIVRQQPVMAQSVRLTQVYFNPKFAAQVPLDLVRQNPEKLVLAWLAADPLVAPYAAKKWEGKQPVIKIVPDAKWAATYGDLQAGHVDPALGRPITLAEAKAKAPRVDGTTTPDDVIYLRAGGASPGALIHEAIHALAPNDFDESFGRAAEEGTTEYFARKVARSAKQHPPKAYPQELAGITALANVIGEPTLATAFFTGSVQRLFLAVDNAKGEGTFVKWRSAMEHDVPNAPNVLK